MLSAKGLNYRELNQVIRREVAKGARSIRVTEVRGQYYIGAGMKGGVRLELEGTAGNDLACYNDGLEIWLRGNAQDGVGNTMNSGSIIIDGCAGDVIGYAMRGGEIFVRGDVGYRAGIHMKEYGMSCPLLVIGGRAGAFLGEYMAGGRIAVLGLNDSSSPCVGPHCGSGMHGGCIYINRAANADFISSHVEVDELDAGDAIFLRDVAARYCRYFGLAEEKFDVTHYIKLVPKGNRPFGSMYVGA